jgi:hypothetical protein
MIDDIMYQSYDIDSDFTAFILLLSLFPSKFDSINAYNARQIELFEQSLMSDSHQKGE